MRLLIASTMDSQQPFGATTRPFHIGAYLSKQFEVCQIGLDCSSVDYTEAVSVGSRRLQTYVNKLDRCVEQFKPDLIYAHETLPAIAACLQNRRSGRPLVFDFHTLSAFEYGTRLTSVAHPLQELKQFIKTYIAQGYLINANRLIIAASQATIDMIPRWYPFRPRMQLIGNGVSEDLLQAGITAPPDPYTAYRPKTIVSVVAPKAKGYEFLSNDMSVDLALEVARYLESRSSSIHFVVIGRNSDNIELPLPENLTFAGFLPSRSDFLAYIAQADIGLLSFPQQAVAGGARNKTLDYLACKTLVVSTPEGVRGLEQFQDQKHLLVTRYDVPEIAETILRVSENPASYQPLTEAAYRLVSSQYSWEALANQLAYLLKQEVDRAL